MTDHDPSLPSEQSPDQNEPRKVSRRQFMLMGAAAAGGTYLAGKAAWNFTEGFSRSETFIAPARKYSGELVSILQGGLSELGWNRQKVRNKSVLLKPSLVDTVPGAEHVHTHPEMIAAVAEVFRKWDAKEVLVAEGPAHHTDTWYLIEKTGIERVLDEHKLEFIDLNHDEVFARDNQLGFTKLRQLMLPICLKRADIVVSVAKMKTHHWAGVTASMKNLFGLMPGICYGWPKNVLHHQGIPQSILDINATVQPDLGIIDGIIGMQGDGPIAGEPIHAGVVLMGNNLPALDATCARLMDFDPFDIPYLRVASSRLGPIQTQHIAQHGENIADYQQRFELPSHPHFAQFRPHEAAALGTSDAASKFH